LIYLNH